VRYSEHETFRARPQQDGRAITPSGHTVVAWASGAPAGRSQMTSPAACVAGALRSRAVSAMLPTTAPTHGRLRGGPWHERLMTRLTQ